MEGKAKIEYAQKLFKYNFIGIEELTPFLLKMGVASDSIQRISLPDLPYSKEDIEQYSKDHILILGISRIEDVELSISSIRERMGLNPELSEPCFYNQDWYLKEKFINLTLKQKWYLIRKEVFEESRAIQPTELVRQGFLFPSAILCTYTFFAYYFAHKVFLWEYDFVWCSDVDHNGDRIYVGKYRDIDGINKNGFSLHRHLALRACYGCISTIKI